MVNNGLVEDIGGIIEDMSEEELGRDYFGKHHAPNERWSSTVFNQVLQRHSRNQSERRSVVERVVLSMLADSRAILGEVITNPPRQISDLINETDNYFRQAFYSVFGRDAPVSPSEVTHLIKGPRCYADGIGGKIFIGVENFYEDRDAFVHYVIHETMHLCFSGFDASPLEEGLIEFFIEKMYQKQPHCQYKRPINDTYNAFKENIKAVFAVLPEAESQFTNYFLTSDIAPLKRYLEVNLNERNVAKIEERGDLRMYWILEPLRMLACKH